MPSIMMMMVTDYFMSKKEDGLETANAKIPNKPKHSNKALVNVVIPIQRRKIVYMSKYLLHIDTV